MRRKTDTDISALLRAERKVNKEQKQTPQPNLHSFSGTFSVCLSSFKFFKCSFLETDRVPFEHEGRKREEGDGGGEGLSKAFFRQQRPLGALGRPGSHGPPGISDLQRLVCGLQLLFKNTFPLGRPRASSCHPTPSGPGQRQASATWAGLRVNSTLGGLQSTRREFDPFPSPPSNDP